MLCSELTLFIHQERRGGKRRHWHRRYYYSGSSFSRKGDQFMNTNIVLIISTIWDKAFFFCNVKLFDIESEFYDIDSTGFLQVLKKASLKITLSRSSVNFWVITIILWGRFLFPVTCHTLVWGHQVQADLNAESRYQQICRWGTWQIFKTCEHPMNIAASIRVNDHLNDSGHGTLMWHDVISDASNFSHLSK